MVTWLLTITRNLAIDTLRVRRPVFVDPDVLVDMVERGRGPEERAVGSSEVARVGASIRTLPVEQQRALLLASFYGQTAKEIVEIEGIPLGTAKTRIRTAMLRVRDSLVERREAE